MVGHFGDWQSLRASPSRSLLHHVMSNLQLGTSELKLGTSKLKFETSSGPYRNLRVRRLFMMNFMSENESFSLVAVNRNQRE